jgi:large conductance mechanosensitive channel
VVYKEFKEFISRGNVIDLAVAVVLGAAFTQIVNALVDGVITPLIGALFDFDFSGWSSTLNGNEIRWGLVLDAAINFLLVAIAIFFFIVKPMNVLAARRRRGEEPVTEEQLSDEAVLLAEIRDLLRQQRGQPGTGAAPGPVPGPGPMAGPMPGREPGR